MVERREERRKDVCTRKTRELTALAITQMPFHAVVDQTFVRDDETRSFDFSLAFAYPFVVFKGEKEDFKRRKNLTGMEI